VVQSLIGPRIRERRRAQKLTQAALARDVGISPSYLNLIEHNRRGIGGSTLHAIARRLGADPRDFSDGADAGLVQGLTEAAAALNDLTVEVDRVGELIGRFPGWAGVLAHLHHRTTAQAESLSMLSDRLNHDPYLAEAMHLILSNITAIQSTAGILATAEELPDDRRERFTKNIHAESERLTVTAKDLVAYLDNPEAQPRHIGDAGSPAQAIWTDIGHDAPALEALSDTDAAMSDAAIAKVIEAASLTAPDEIEARRTLRRHAALARAMPLATFADEVAATAYDPLALSRRLGRPIADILLRLSHLPYDEGRPDFGMIECDASGGVLMRKDHSAMTLPKTNGACPLWPLYRAFSQPGQPIRALMETPAGTNLIAYAITVGDNVPAPFGMPPVLRAIMIFTDHKLAMPSQRGAAPIIPIGPHCSVCPRKTCASRRMPYILG
jgi:transcriptional regulator with XRE-family HTH domain